MILSSILCCLPLSLLFLLAVASFFVSDMIAEAYGGPYSPQHDANVVRSTANMQLSASSIKILRNPVLLYNNLQDLSRQSAVGHQYKVSSKCKESRKKLPNSLFRTRQFTESQDEKPFMANHYICPPTSVDILRRRYGTSGYFGDWSMEETRRFYKSQLPKALLIEGALGLTLEERALLASEARHALRLYARERSNFVARVFAEVYDGLRHLQSFGYWSSTGMNWEEVKLKYRREAIQVLGSSAPKEEIDFHVYNRILERSCATNIVLDEIAHKKMDCKDVVKVIKSFDKSSDKLIAFETIKDLKPLVVWLSLLISPFYAVGFAN